MNDKLKKEMKIFEVVDFALNDFILHRCVFTSHLLLTPHLIMSHKLPRTFNLIPHHSHTDNIYQDNQGMVVPHHIHLDLD